MKKIIVVAALFVCSLLLQAVVYTNSVRAEEMSVIDYTDKNQPDQKLIEPDKWFIIPSSGQASMKAGNGKVELSDIGTAGYKNKLQFSKLSFQIVCDFGTNSDAWTLFQFHKMKRDSYYGEAHAVFYDGQGYGIMLLRDGYLRLIKTATNGKQDVLETIETGLDFTKLQTVTIDFKEDKENKKAEFIIRLNNDSKAYKILDDQYDEEYQVDGGYLGLVNSSFFMKSSVENISFTGKEIEINQKKQPKPVYLLDYFEEGDRSFIHWKYNEGTLDCIKVEITDGSGSLVSELPYPIDIFDIDKGFKGKKLFVTAVNVDGMKSIAREVTLEENFEKYMAKKVERIVIKEGEEFATFNLKESGSTFIVNGFDYINLRCGDHANFDADTKTTKGRYDPYDVESSFKTMRKNGYNTVRVFVTGRSSVNRGISGDYEETQGIYEPYMDNFVDFLKRAKKYGIYVVSAFGDNELPVNKFYTDMSGRINGNHIIVTKEGIEAKKHYLKSFLSHIQAKDPELLKVFLALEMQNEVNFSAVEWPFTEQQGKILMPDGKEYDMANVEERQQLADNAFLYYYQNMVDVVKGIDPELLVCEGAFTLKAVGKDPETHKGLMSSMPDPRYPPTMLVLAKSAIDFIDIHVYTTAFQEEMETMKFNDPEMKELRKKKPIIMGEFGAFAHDGDLERASKKIMTIQSEALKEHFNGMMMWTFDAFEQRNLYHVMDDEGGLLKNLSLIKVEEKLASTEEKNVSKDNEKNKEKESGKVNPFFMIALAAAGVIAIAGAVLFRTLKR